MIDSGQSTHLTSDTSPGFGVRLRPRPTSSGRRVPFITKRASRSTCHTDNLSAPLPSCHSPAKDSRFQQLTSSSESYPQVRSRVMAVGHSVGVPAYGKTPYGVPGCWSAGMGRLPSSRGVGSGRSMIAVDEWEVCPCATGPGRATRSRERREAPPSPGVGTAAPCGRAALAGVTSNLPGPPDLGYLLCRTHTRAPERATTSAWALHFPASQAGRPATRIGVKA